MENLEAIQLMDINGGAISKWLVFGIAVGVAFVISTIYGFIYPNKCG